MNIHRDNLSRRSSVCPEFADDLVELADEELSVEREPVVREHVANCDSCQSELARLRESLALATDLWRERAGQVADVGHGNDITTFSIASAGAAASGEGPGRSTSRRLVAWGVTGVAAGLLIAMAGLWWFSGDNRRVAGLTNNGPENGPANADGSNRNSANSSTNNGTANNGTANNGGPSDPSAGENSAANEMAVELARLQREIEDVAQTARLTAAAGYLKEQPSLQDEYESAMAYIKRRGTD